MVEAVTTPYVIVPYTTTDGVPSFRDSEIAGWFARIESEETLRWLFFDGSVIYAEDFIKLVKAPRVFFFTVWTGGEPEAEMVGFFWLRDFIGNAAFLHHVIFKKFWGTEARRIGRFVLEFIFGAGPEEKPPLVGTLLGLTPVNNIPALRFARAIGMKRSGRIPGVFYDVYSNAAVDGHVSWMTRETCVETKAQV